MEHKELWGLRGRGVGGRTACRSATPRVRRAGRRRDARHLVAHASHAALAAAEAAAQRGVSVEVIDLRTIWPWDREAVLASAAQDAAPAGRARGGRRRRASAPRSLRRWPKSSAFRCSASARRAFRSATRAARGRGAHHVRQDPAPQVVALCGGGRPRSDPPRRAERRGPVHDPFQGDRHAQDLPRDRARPLRRCVAWPLPARRADEIPARVPAVDRRRHRLPLGQGRRDLGEPRARAHQGPHQHQDVPGRVAGRRRPDARVHRDPPGRDRPRDRLDHQLVAAGEGAEPVLAAVPDAGLRRPSTRSRRARSARTCSAILEKARRGAARLGRERLPRGDQLQARDPQRRRT